MDWRRLQSTIGAGARQLVPPAGSGHRDPAVGRAARVPGSRRPCSTKPSGRRNGTRRIWRTGSGRRAGMSRPAATSGSAATSHLGSTTIGAPSQGISIGSCGTAACFTSGGTRRLRASTAAASHLDAPRHAAGWAGAPRRAPWRAPRTCGGPPGMSRTVARQHRGTGSPTCPLRRRPGRRRCGSCRSSLGHVGARLYGFWLATG